MNLVCIHLSVSIAKVDTKPIAMYAHFRDIASIRSGILRNTKSFIKTEVNQFAQLWIGQIHEFKKPKDFFVECSKK